MVLICAASLEQLSEAKQHVFKVNICYQVPIWSGSPTIKEIRPVFLVRMDFSKTNSTVS